MTFYVDVIFQLLPCLPNNIRGNFGTGRPRYLWSFYLLICLLTNETSLENAKFLAKMFHFILEAGICGSKMLDVYTGRPRYMRSLYLRIRVSFWNVSPNLQSFLVFLYANS